jgi:hypothetical protein
MFAMGIEIHPTLRGPKYIRRIFSKIKSSNPLYNFISRLLDLTIRNYFDRSHSLDFPVLFTEIIDSYIIMPLFLYFAVSLCPAFYRPFNE